MHTFLASPIEDLATTFATEHGVPKVLYSKASEPEKEGDMFHVAIEMPRSVDAFIPIGKRIQQAYDRQADEAEAFHAILAQAAKDTKALGVGDLQKPGNGMFTDQGDTYRIDLYAPNEEAIRTGLEKIGAVWEETKAKLQHSTAASRA